MQAVKQTVTLESFDHQEALKMLLLSDRETKADYIWGPFYLFVSFQSEFFSTRDRCSNWIIIGLK